MAGLGVFLIMALFIFFFTGCLKQRICNSSMRMINADWLDESERFKLIARWGA